MEMAADDSVVSVSWPKWQLALALGIPVAVGGLGYWYYKSGQSTDNDTRKSSEKNSYTKLSQNTNLDVKSEVKPLIANGDNLKSEDFELLDNALVMQLDLLEKSQAVKNKGNDLFKMGKYNDAIKCYNEAILLCPANKTQDLATFYQNRAAAYEQLKDFESVKKDTSEALLLNPKYTKALHRRAKACEFTKEYSQCLEDVTAACILEGFQNQSTLLMADRVLKELGQKHAKEAMLKRVTVMPSKHFILSYFTSFVNDPVMHCLVEAEDATEGFLKARLALKETNHEMIIGACTEEIDNPEAKYFYEALLLRGTFHLLLGDNKPSLEDLGQVIDNEDINVKLRVNALIKRASLKLQMEDAEKSIQDFDLAVDLDPDNSDIYHHRGQVFLLMEKIEDAIRDLEKSCTLKPDFPVVYVQKLYTLYRRAMTERDFTAVQNILTQFKEAKETYPKCAECCILYAQVLTEQQDFENAEKAFYEGLAIEPENATVYVHLGLLILQWKGDVEVAVKTINKAVEIDDKCEFGYETLGTIEVQRGNLSEAISLFDKAIPLAKTEMEMGHLFSLRDAAAAQARVVEKMGISVPGMMP